MMKLNKYLLLAAFFIAPGAMADWQLQQPSEVTFVSSKNTHLLEVHRFNQLSGQITDSGLASIQIDLASIDSRIPIRDKRMRDQLFEVSSFSSATIEAQIPPKLLNELKQGNLLQTELAARLSLHGSSEELTLKLLVAPTAGKQLVVTSLEPVLIHANDFALTKGIQLLRDIAKLKAISEVVPVNFALTFAPGK